MPRPLRHLEPGQLWFVTDRCAQAQFLLAPDPACVNLLGYWLGMALRRFPGVKLCAFAQMSNHLHLAVRDDAGQLADFACYFFGNVAKDGNALRQRSGSFFHRRYSAEPILDDESLLSRVVYAVTNPVKALLVHTFTDWPGFVAFAGDGRTFKFYRPHRRKDSEDSQPVAITFELPELEDGPTATEVLDAVEATEAELQKDHNGWVVGRERVLAQSPFDAPAKPKSSRRPLCHAKSARAAAAFRAGWAALCAAFREASAALRAGDRTAVFPRYMFAPHVFVRR